MDQKHYIFDFIPSTPSKTVSPVSPHCPKDLAERISYLLNAAPARLVTRRPDLADAASSNLTRAALSAAPGRKVTKCVMATEGASLSQLRDQQVCPSSKRIIEVTSKTHLAGRTQKQSLASFLLTKTSGFGLHCQASEPPLHNRLQPTEPRLLTHRSLNT